MPEIRSTYTIPMPIISKYNNAKKMERSVKIGEVFVAQLFVTTVIIIIILM